MVIITVQGEAGHSTDMDWRSHRIVYDDGVAVPAVASDRRPCRRCHLPPTIKGHDPCIADLPGVRFACCGHGFQEGYVMFEDERVFCFRNKTGPEIRAMVTQYRTGKAPLRDDWTWD
jgi:hypothetical protein